MHKNCLPNVNRWGYIFWWFSQYTSGSSDLSNGGSVMYFCTSTVASAVAFLALLAADPSLSKASQSFVSENRNIEIIITETFNFCQLKNKYSCKNDWPNLHYIKQIITLLVLAVLLWRALLLHVYQLVGVWSGVSTACVNLLSEFFHWTICASDLNL